MNKQRRKELNKFRIEIDAQRERLENLRGQLDTNGTDHEGVDTLIPDVRSKLDDIRSQLDTLREEEQDYYDNMPENMQSGERGDKAQEAVSSLESADGDLDGVETELSDALKSFLEDSEFQKDDLITALDNVTSSLESATSSIEEATNA